LWHQLSSAPLLSSGVPDFPLFLWHLLFFFPLQLFLLPIFFLLLLLLPQSSSSPQLSLLLCVVFLLPSHQPVFSFLLWLPLFSFLQQLSHLLLLSLLQP